MKYLLIILFAFIVIQYIYRRVINKKKANLLSQKRADIEEAVNVFELYSNNNQYFNHRKLVTWREHYKSLFGSIPPRFASLPLKKEFVKNILKFRDYYNHSEKHQQAYNQKFIINEIKLNKQLFDTLESYPLTEKQREAIVSDEDNNLIIAGAGTGKTSTLLGKIIYLLSVRKVSPENILALAFTSKAAEEIRERIKTKTKDEMDIKTFHKFGLDIISSVEKEKPSVAFNDDDGSETLRKFIYSVHKELLKEKKYQEILSTYFLSYLRPYMSPESFKNKGEYYKSLKSYKTLKKETLKSFEEIEIANFLFANDINYIYENDYEYKTANQNYSQYKPDFYLPDNKIYIEHFGLIDRSGNVPGWFSPRGFIPAKEAYNQSMTWKRVTHKKYGTTLIETFSYEKKEGTLLEFLKKHLIQHGVKFSVTPLQIIKHFEEKDELPPFINLVITFLNLMKSNGYSINELYLLAQKNKSIREGKFLQVFKPIYEKYQLHLHDKNKIDFSDMLIKAADYIKTNKYKKTYQYILIDEFQDMSIGRYKLISNLLNQNLDQRLFCVGDDWQSIYRFTGSDISIITEFEKYFGYTKKVDLDLSFRLNKDVCDFTMKFIRKNNKQRIKNLSSTKQSNEPPYEILYQDSDSALEKCFDKILLNKGNTQKKKVIILGRYNFDEPVELIKIKNKYNTLDISFLTVHKSKGLEADYIILFNVNAGKYGFPSEIIDDPILNLVLKIQGEIQNAEERRLFYVALTRTKNSIYIICNRNNISKFVHELLIESPQVRRCPDCKEGILIVRKTKITRKEFWACDNYPLCTYKKWK